MIKSFVTVYNYQVKLKLTHEEKEILSNAIKDYIYACARHYDREGLVFARRFKT